MKMTRAGLAITAGNSDATALAMEVRSENRGDDLASTRWPRDPAARLVIIAVALILTWHTWARWGSIQVDCGRELYVPLEVLRGNLLYRDIWYDYGPLTPYVEAALIWIFGKHLVVFYSFGIALAIGCALLLYELGKILGGRGVGLVAALIFLLGGFNPTIFSFGLPYTYAAPLGLFLGLVCAWLATRFVLRGELAILALAGVAASLTLLCKPEIGAAAYVMLAFAIVAAAVLQRSWRILLTYLGECVPGGLLWMGIYGWFFWKVGPSVILFDNWINTPGTYFARTFGARADARIGLRFGASDIVVVLFTAAITLIFWFLIAEGACLKPAALGNSVVALWALVPTCLAAAARAGMVSESFLRLLLDMIVFPVGMVLIGCGSLLYALRAGFTNRLSRRTLAEMVFAVFALLLAVRVLAAVSPYGYGLFYAAPLSVVFLLVIARFLGWIMRGVEDRRRRNLMNVSLALEALLMAILVVPGTSRRTVPFETSWGTLYLTPKDAAGARKIFAFTSEQKREGRRVVFLPELPMMYAFTGTEAPSMWYSVVPGYVPPAKEGAYISDLRKAHPVYVVLTNESTRVYGVPYFGLDYNRKIYRWIEKHYRLVGQLGDFRREKDAPLAALIYERDRQR